MAKSTPTMDTFWGEAEPLPRSHRKLERGTLYHLGHPATVPFFLSAEQMDGGYLMTMYVPASTGMRELQDTVQGVALSLEAHEMTFRRSGTRMLYPGKAMRLDISGSGYLK